MLIRQNKPVLPVPGNFNAFLLKNTLLWQACGSLVQERQVAYEMAMATMLGGVAISAQGRYDVRLPYGVVRPISLSICIVAESGEGKSAVENKVMGPLRNLQDSENIQHKLRMKEYEQALDSWQLEHDTLRNIVRKAILKGGGDVTNEKQAVYEHYALQPSAPRPFRLLYQNTTDAALFQGLMDGIPSAALSTDEGSIFFRSQINQSKGHLNALYSGDDTIINRATKPDIVLSNCRLSVFLMVQPGVLKRHLKLEDRESGWLARQIVCAPASVRGTRRFSMSASEPSDSWIAAEHRLKALADENLVLRETPDLPRKILEFSEHASELWFQLSNEIECQIGPGGRFEGCADHASKLTDNISRVAAMIHVFEQYDGDISSETLEMAIELCSHFSSHFQQVMMPPPQEVQDAYLLNAWFNELRSFNNRVITYNHARQCGPSALRNKQRLKEAIDVILAHNEIVLFQQGKTKMIDLMPHLGPIYQTST